MAASGTTTDAEGEDGDNDEDDDEVQDRQTEPASQGCRMPNSVWRVQMAGTGAMCDAMRQGFGLAKSRGWMIRVRPMAKGKAKAGSQPPQLCSMYEWIDSAPYPFVVTWSWRLW